MAHQLDSRRVADAYGREIGFLEISVNPERVSIGQRDEFLPRGGKVALPRQQVRNPAISGRTDLGALEVDSGLIETCHGLLVLRLRNCRVAGIDTRLANASCATARCGEVPCPTVGTSGRYRLDIVCISLHNPTNVVAHLERDT